MIASSSFRRTVLGLVVTVGLISGTESLQAQFGVTYLGCHRNPEQEWANSLLTDALKTYTDVYIRPASGRMARPVSGLGGLARMLGELHDSLAASGRRRPVTVLCSLTDNTGLFVPQGLSLSDPTASGGATGGGTFGGNLRSGMSSPALRLTDNVVVGYADRGDFTTFHAFRSTPSGGITDLGTLDPANNATRTSMATGSSADGSVVVGFSEISTGAALHAFRWTSAGMVDLGAPAGATRDSRALAVNDDGTVLVGDATFSDAAAFSGFRSGAFRWTAAGGFQNLGALEPGFFSVATSVSGDGATVVGQGGVQIVSGGSSTNGSRAFRWTSATGIVPIGPLPGHAHAIANAVSDNGNVIVGTSSPNILSYNLVGGPQSGTAFRWTQAGGIQDLKQLLVNAGVNLTGITLVSASSVSADGEWIIGNAVLTGTPAGETRPFIAKYCDAAIGGACTPLATPVASFTLGTQSSTTPSVVAGGSAMAALSVTPINGFNATVTFSCSGLATGITCAFAPATVAPNNSVAATTLTIKTTAPAASLALSLADDSTPFLLTIATLTLLGMLRATPRQRWARMAFAGGAVVTIVACSGDGGGTTPSGGTPAGTYPITVTATSGSGASAVSRTLTITLTVTR